MTGPGAAGWFSAAAFGWKILGFAPGAEMLYLKRFPSVNRPAALPCPAPLCGVGVTRTVLSVLVPPLREEEEAKESSGWFRVNLHSPGCWSLAPRSSPGQSSAELLPSIHRKPCSPVLLFLIKEGDTFLVVFVVCSFCLGMGEAPQGLMWMDVEIHGWCQGC